MKGTSKSFIPVMITPFLSSGEIDFAGVTRLTERYLEAGAKGLFANCLSSEMFDLGDKERLQLVKHVVRIVNGSVPVVASGTFEGSTDQQALFVKKMYDCGVEAVIAITNMLAAEDEPDTILEERMFELFQHTSGIPLGLYECPFPYKRTINAGQLKSFTDSGRVSYLKDTCLDIEQVKQKLEATKGCIDFGLYDAYMLHGVESLTAGAAGLSCIQGNYWPELIVWICNNYNNENVSTERTRIMNFLEHNMQLMHYGYPAAAKYYWQKRGLPITTFTRQELGELTPAVTRNIDKLHVGYADLIKELNLNIRI
ncbi:MAG: dihydrodipicolinate synthase family protein [Chitinophagaceae bacterium]|nr:MAG: dihydrodipicolinate synthase family protein [Chitinophagaceae bacterium]